MPTLADLRATHLTHSKPVSTNTEQQASDSLVSDSRNHIRPTQYVEEKLQLALNRPTPAAMKQIEQ